MVGLVFTFILPPPARPGAGAWAVVRVVATLLLGLLGATGCGGKHRPAEAGSPVAGATNEPGAITAGAATASAQPDYLPAVVPHSGYAGPESCRPCHADEHASWQRSFHRTMTQFPSRASVKADFKGVVLTNDATRFTLLNEGDRYGVRVEYLEPPAPGEPVRDPAQIVLGLVTGSHHMQVFWLPNGAGNCQVGFPFTWLIPEKRWVPRTMTFLRPPDAPHRQEVWNAVCIRCHATGMEPHFRPSQGQINSRVADLGISCEACHGPAQQHVDLARSEVARAKGPTAGVAITNWHIVQPLKLDSERGSQVCAFCHSMKQLDAREHWFDAGFSYRPGDDLEKTTPIIRHPSTNAPGPLAEYLRANPDLLQDFFWSDGMIRVSGREYNGLIESPCHKGGRFTCFSCHSLHQSEPNDQLSATRQDHRACTQCHLPLQDPAAQARHTHHAGGSAGSDCYNCHMPHTTYGVLTAIRSHTVSSPRVADQLATGRPNACNLCHLDQTLAWTAGWLREWYRQPMPPAAAAEATLSEGVRLGLAGDAGQRVLLAWHLGWAPAQATSGREWLAPVLGELLEDPYAAVRCVAERSLKSLLPGGVTGYDFTQEPPVTGAGRAVWNQFQGVRATADPQRVARTGVQLEDPAGTSARFRAVRAQRIERPLRLRE